MAKLTIVAVILVLAAAMSLTEAQNVAQCVSKLISCSDYLKFNTTPGADCCNAIKDAVTNDFTCLCTCKDRSEVAPIIVDLSIGVSTPSSISGLCKSLRIRAGNSSLPHGQGQPHNNLPPPIPPQTLPQLPPQVPTIFPPADHAEGGDENQPHASAHNSTSTANQDVVTTQLAAMQQQFGVFQLVLAQLLARNNPGDVLINLLNPAQQPSVPQQNPQPVQPIPAVSESQGQSHIAPAQQPIPDDVTRCLDSLEKLVAEHRGAPPPHHAADSIPHPLNTNITLEPYPIGFKIPQLETYDGTKDPDDHLHAFYSCILNPEERAELIAFLRANNDVFAWTSADMPGIPTSVCQHKLSTNPLKKLVAQKRRLFGGERLQAVKEEVEKLLQAGFIRKVDYCEWVANPVLVKKANGKWRMCIDYTNLNNACPKDCYPMPSIDKLVEAASGNERLSLLDAYSGYHQVPMAPEDEEKTAFYAGDEIYCYVIMPFGLKNAGATYQKMVTIVFHAQIGKNLEVYVDDIVVKSLKAEDHLADLDETFNNLRKNRMRLNPAKCIFGVESGKFLGFMVSRRGIEVNPEKIRAIAEMEPPKSIKDIQRLTGRVAALHRFISRSADKCLPFFKIMSSPPLLTKAVDGELLYLYLGISDEAISSVLVREEARQQKPIYYISSVLHGAELRYPIAEKAALAVVTSARKLRPYFQSHPIIVLTDQPLRQILQKPECSGRLIKWAVELGEFEITFQQRSAIRAQALADFVVECTPCPSTSTLEPNEWTLYVDGASSSKGSGAGALLIGPDGY
ncbi:hypothetical protein SLEP1_g8835 [Rubroshorea leprosula]|uniref:Reverse transcriptase domain-containing protein n=1 Tax=Rubroshorea leprosula TaxID=152421 RepID=A0AAV5I315_9ROSI|nr:hypothetical protein SLEP1_g8835 [Rubroshorea leprosula]